MRRDVPRTSGSQEPSALSPANPPQVRPTPSERHERRTLTAQAGDAPNPRVSGAKTHVRSRAPVPKPVDPFANAFFGHGGTTDPMRSLFDSDAHVKHGRENTSPSASLNQIRQAGSSLLKKAI